MQDDYIKEIWCSTPIFYTRNPSGYDGEYVAEGSRRDLYITIYYVEETVVKVEFKDQTVTSGYWHDNPNYPFADYITKIIEVIEPLEIKHLAQSLEISDLTPRNMLEEMKSLFSTIDDVIFFLSSNGIKYEVDDNNPAKI